MAKVPSDQAQDFYRIHKRENFAASQRLEGINTPATERGDTKRLMSKEELRKKYARRG